MIECLLTRGMDGLDLAVMHLIRYHRPDRGEVMTLVIPVEKFTAKASGVLDATEAFVEARLVFQCYKAAFRERNVVGVCGWLCKWVTPRFANSRAAALAFIGPA